MFETFRRQLELGKECVENLNNDMGDPVLQRIADDHRSSEQKLEDECYRALYNLKSDLEYAKKSYDLL